MMSLVSLVWVFLRLPITISHTIDQPAGLGLTVVSNRAAPTTNGALAPVGTETVKAYLGGVNIATPPGASNDATTLAILCEADLSPVNGGASGFTPADIVVPATDAAPGCPVGQYQAIN
jgi:hypothetical protein